ncbi:hypothetical protein EV175_002757 [Coemansia sp. RSA 1933]|nr:hypothetical protein EV175_002757 [Coemansia sp. RSA 1933]
MGFAYGLGGWSLGTYVEGEFVMWDGNDTTPMNPPGNTTVEGTTIVGGDLFMQERDMPTSDSEESSLEADGSSQHHTDGSSGGLSRGGKIAIGVAVPMGAILIAMCTVILVHIWKTKRQDKAWNPNAQQLDLHEAGLEMSVQEPYVVPPPYTQTETIRDGQYRRIAEPEMVKKQ